jgi:hypothetical protein
VGLTNLMLEVSTNCTNSERWVQISSSVQGEWDASSIPREVWGAWVRLFSRRRAGSADEQGIPLSYSRVLF